MTTATDNAARRIILDNPEHTDLGPATPEQIAASEPAPGGLILIDDDGRVVRPGQFGAAEARRCWID